MKCRFLLFDSNAIFIYVNKRTLQSMEYTQGRQLVKHIRGQLASEIFEGTAVEYCDGGIIFCGEKPQNASKEADAGERVFCFDLTACDNLLAESDASLLFIFQKAFRTALKIWNRHPFSASERVHESKSILFPFAYPDPRRLVIERSKSTLQLEKRSIDFPLLAYKYNCEEPSQDNEPVNVSVLKAAGKIFNTKRYELRGRLKDGAVLPQTKGNALHSVNASQEVGREDFIYWSYESQYQNLTELQKEVVDDDALDSPLRIDGAAGTGKTMSMIMRAYRLLESHQKGGSPFRTIFFTHSQSTFQRTLDAFRNYPNSCKYLDPNSPQHIEFVTLSDYCANFASIPLTSLLERDAGDAKTFQLMLVETVLSSPDITNKVRTFRPLISPELCDMFDEKKTSPGALYNMLQHEFSVQIKGRTDSTIDTYYQIPPIPNGLPCSTKKDKELIFSLFIAYQNALKAEGSFDVDDVVMEALARLNAPIWRRERAVSGYDYIFVDEMHLFNINEQSVFHFLTRDLYQTKIPICFALDYSQAVGDRGNISADYIECTFDKAIRKKYHTVFRNSPQITDFCASIAASGVLMFRDQFSDPYHDTHSDFLLEDEAKSRVPSLYEYDSDDEMLASLDQHLQNIVRDLRCNPRDIVVIAFDSKFYSEQGIRELCCQTGRSFTSLCAGQRDSGGRVPAENYVLASPYDINGMEFQAVVLLGVDEGRVPQTMGTSDISQHFIKYSAYNLLYLSASRAKYRLTILGNRLKGRSSCLDHSIEAGYLVIGGERTNVPTQSE